MVFLCEFYVLYFGIIVLESLAASSNHSGIEINECCPLGFIENRIMNILVNISVVLWSHSADFRPKFDIN